eukprot:3707782-Pleurochrysis_carterae.AAC.1
MTIRVGHAAYVSFTVSRASRGKERACKAARRTYGSFDSLWASIMHGSGVIDGGCRCGGVNTPGRGIGRCARVCHVDACATASAGAVTDSMAMKRVRAAATEKEECRPVHGPKNVRL